MSNAKQRYLFIDLLRFVAVFFMIQGHVFDALLSPQVKSLSLYYLHDLFHGFIAPAFFFGSGVAYGISTIRRWEEHTVWGKRPLKRAGKFLGLIAIGYALHLPYFSLRKIMDVATPGEIGSWLQADALQCIGVTLLLLQICVLFTKNRRVFLRVVVLAAVAVMLSAPLMWSFAFKGHVPMWLGTYLNSEYGSWFPLFPWSAYILCGVVLGYAVVDAREDVLAAGVMRMNAALSAGMLVLALIVMRLPFTIYPPHDFWKSDPTMVIVRVAVVSLVMCGMFFVEHTIRIPSRIPMIMGRESLFIYIIHLLIVYGSVLGRGLSSIFGPTLSLSQSLGAFALVYLAVILVTVLWHELNSKYRDFSQRLVAFAAAVFVFEFLIRPF